MELAGKTFGIVGLGNIGRRVTEIALAFGMQVKALTSKSANTLPTGIKKADLEELLATSDVISLHCPPKADNPLLSQPNAFITPLRGCQCSLLSVHQVQHPTYIQPLPPKSRHLAHCREIHAETTLPSC